MVTVPVSSSFLNVLATTPLYSGVGLRGSQASSAEITELLARLDEQGDRDNPAFDSISILKGAGRVNGSGSHDKFLKALGLQLDGMPGKDRMAVQIAAATTLVRGNPSHFLLRKSEEVQKGTGSLLGVAEQKGENVEKIVKESGIGLLEMGGISSDLTQARREEKPHFQNLPDLSKPLKSWFWFWANVHGHRASGLRRRKDFAKAADRYVKAAYNWQDAGELWTAAALFLSAEECYRMDSAPKPSEAQKALDRAVACYLEEGFDAHAAYAYLQRRKYGEAAMMAYRLVESNGHDRINADVVCSLAKRAILSHQDDPTETRLLSFMQASFAFALSLKKLYFLSALHFLDAAANANKAGDLRRADTMLHSALHLAKSKLGLTL